VDHLRQSLLYLNDEDILKEAPELSQFANMSKDALTIFRRSDEFN